jgi:MFS family permease
MASSTTGAAAQRRLVCLVLILFLSYLCVAVAVPVVPLFVTGDLGFGNAIAGLGVGSAFLATIVSRGRVGAFADRRGAKRATVWGLACYGAGGLVCLAAGLATGDRSLAFAFLLAGRLIVGIGESLVGVGIVAWGVGIVGPERAGRVLALVGAALYGAFAVGGPLGVALGDAVGFAGAMAAATVLPLVGLIAVLPLAGVAAHPEAERPPFSAVLALIWPYGAVVCLQGIGFAGLGAFLSLSFVARGWPWAGFGLTGFGLGFVLVRLVFGHLPDRVGGLRVAIVSLAVETAGQLLIWLAPDPMLALAGAFLTGLGCSLVFPSMGREVVHRVAPALRATALGAFAAFQDLAYGLTGPLAGLLADRAGYGSVFLLGAGAAAVGCAVALALWRARAVEPA